MKWQFPGSLLLGFAAGTLLSLVSCACKPGKSEPDPLNHLFTASDVKASAKPFDNAVLILAGSEVPCKVVREENGEQVKLRFVAYDQTIEEEIYEATDSGFRLVEAAGEKYAPAIPLLKFPMNIGDASDWAGQTYFGEVARPAKAKIETAKKKENLPGGPYDTIYISVTLQIESGGPEPAVRQLEFWIEPTHGVIKRQFGASSTRVPAKEPLAEP